MSEARAPALLIDPSLPGLSGALDAAVMAPRLATMAARLAGDDEIRPEDWRVVAVDVLKHKPGRRCSLAYTLAGPSGQRRLFAKTFSGERGATILATMSRIAAAVPRERLLIPRPAGYVAELKLLVTEHLDGIPLAGPLYEGASDGPVDRMASALRELHGCGAAFARRWSALREVANTAEWLGGLTGRGAAARVRARALLQALSTWASRLPHAPDCPVHRDFYADQVWDCEGRTALLDLDDTRCGDPALDLGNFLAHLTLRSLQFPQVAEGCARARGRFVDQYERQEHGPTGEGSLRERVRFYEAASLLRLSGVYGGRERWADVLPNLLIEACGAILQTGLGG